MRRTLADSHAVLASVLLAAGTCFIALLYLNNPAVEQIPGDTVDAPDEMNIVYPRYYRMYAVNER